jgi:hypothetical protein
MRRPTAVLIDGQANPTRLRASHQLFPQPEIEDERLLTEDMFTGIDRFPGSEQLSPADAL